MSQTDTLLTVLRQNGFDTAVGIDLVGGDAEFYAELMGDLYSDLLAADGAFLSADATGDETTIRRVHSLKSSLRTLGANAGATLAETVETGLCGGSVTEGDIAALNAHVAALRAALGPYCSN